MIPAARLLAFAWASIQLIWPQGSVIHCINFLAHTKTRLISFHQAGCWILIYSGQVRPAVQSLARLHALVVAPGVLKTITLP